MQHFPELSSGAAHISPSPDKAERRVLEEELTVHLSVPGDTILINNRPGPREPPPYQEPRPRGNPAHPAPSVPNGSGETCLALGLPLSSPPVFLLCSFPVPLLLCRPQFQLIFLFLCLWSLPTPAVHVPTL